MAGCTGVGCHAQVVEDQASAFVELAHFLSDATHALGFDQTDGETAQAGDVLGATRTNSPCPAPGLN